MDETLTTQQHVEDIPRPVDRDAVLLKKDKKKRGPREARQSVVPRGKTKRKDSVQYNVKEEGTYVANDQHPIHPAVTQTDPYFPSVSEQRLTHPYPTSLDEDDLYDHHAPPSQEYGGGQYMEVEYQVSDAFHVAEEGYHILGGYYAEEAHSVLENGGNHQCPDDWDMCDV